MTVHQKWDMILANKMCKNPINDCNQKCMTKVLILFEKKHRKIWMILVIENSGTI